MQKPEITATVTALLVLLPLERITLLYIHTLALIATKNAIKPLPIRMPVFPPLPQGQRGLAQYADQQYDETPLVY